MKIKLNSASSGIALIMVMIVVMVLAILAGGFAYSMKVETKLARNASNDSELEWMGRSGIELAKYILAQEFQKRDGRYDSLRDRWAGGPGDTNGVLAEIPMDHYQLGNGWFALKIVDMDRKFNINVAANPRQPQPEVLRRALTLVGVDAAAFPTIVDSILDWCDPNDSTQPNGTESDTYRHSTPPYFAKNGPIDDLSELLLINGVTPAMYWGSSGGGARAQVMNRPTLDRRTPIEEPAYLIGFVELFTTISGGKINANTASLTDLQVLPFIEENIASAIISGPAGRAGPDGADGTEDDMPFRSVGEMARVPELQQVPPQFLQQYFNTQSLVFEVRVDAHVNSSRRQFVALLRRNSPRDIQILNLNWK